MVNNEPTRSATASRSSERCCGELVTAVPRRDPHRARRARCPPHQRTSSSSGADQHCWSSITLAGTAAPGVARRAALKPPKSRRTAPGGALQACVTDGVVPAVGALQAEFSATVNDTALEGYGSFHSPQLGLAKLSARGRLENAAITLQSLLRVLGEVRLDVSDVELGEISRRWLSPEGITLSGLVGGNVQLSKCVSTSQRR